MNRLALGTVVYAVLGASAVQAQGKWDISKIDTSKLPPASKEKGVTFEKDIQPMLESACLRCHGEQRPRGNLRLDSRDAVLKGGQHGKVVTVGKSDKSSLVIAASQIEPRIAMPPKGGGFGGRGGPGGPGGPGRGGPGGGPEGPAGGPQDPSIGPGMLLGSAMLEQGDKNKDKKLTRAELGTLGDTWYAKLDPKKSGKVSQEEFSEQLSNILTARGGKGGDKGGKGPRGKKDGPQASSRVAPGFFSATDTDKNGSLTKDELKTTFTKWFDEWDAEKKGSVTEEQIRGGLDAALRNPQGDGPGAGPAGPGGQGVPPGPGGGPGPQGLSPEQVSLLRAWIDQGAK